MYKVEMSTTAADMIDGREKRLPVRRVLVEWKNGWQFGFLLRAT
jgi:hypothetical protein